MILHVICKDRAANTFSRERKQQVQKQTQLDKHHGSSEQGSSELMVNGNPTTTSHVLPPEEQSSSRA